VKLGVGRQMVSVALVEKNPMKLSGGRYPLTFVVKSEKKGKIAMFF